MEHNTTETTNLIRTYLEEVFSLPLACRAFTASDHDGRDGEPVAAVEVEGEFSLYPIMGTRKTIAGTYPAIQWCIDRLVDASDPSVGIFGCEPVDHSTHDSLSAAVVEIARLVAESRAYRHIQAEADRAYAEECESRRDMDFAY